jgi:hypothetical protein
MSEYFSVPKTSWCILQDYIIAYIGNLRNATRLLVNLQFCLFLSRSVAHFLIYRPNFWFKPDVNCYISHKLMDLHVPSHLVRAFRPLENHDHACGAEICCLWTVSRSMSIQAHVYILSIHADVRFVMCGLVRRVVWGMRCRRNHAAVLCFMRAAGRGSRASLTHVYADVQLVDLGDMLSHTRICNVLRVQNTIQILWKKKIGTITGASCDLPFYWIPHWSTPLAA